MKKMKTMTEGVIWKEILFFAIPLILGNLFQQLYNTVDSIIVGNYVGSNALAAVGSSGAIINLLIGFCIGASTGAGVVISQFYGAKNTEGVRKAVHTTMAIALVAGVLLTVIGITVTPSMLRLMGTPNKVFEQSVIYLQVYFGGSLFSVVYNMSAGVLNAVGNSRRSLVYLGGCSECRGQFQTFPGIPADRGDFKYIPGSDHGCRTEAWNRWRGTGYGYQSVDIMHFYMGISDQK